MLSIVHETKYDKSCDKTTKKDYKFSLKVRKFTDKNIFDDSFLVSNTFPGFPPCGRTELLTLSEKYGKCVYTK